MLRLAPQGRRLDGGTPPWMMGMNASDGEGPPMLDDRDLSLLQRLATTAHGTADSMTLAAALGLAPEEATDHLWHLQGAGCVHVHLAQTRYLWSMTEPGRARLPAAA